MIEILSPNMYVGRLKPTRLVVLHTMEVDENDSSAAESVGNAFANPARVASAHVGVDIDSGCRYVYDENTAWAAPGANADGLQLEMAGRAAQGPADWEDAASQTILERGAQQVAEWCAKFNIPVVHLTDDELAAGAAGIVDHAAVSRVYKKSTHWDCGPDFPFGSFIARVHEIMGSAPTPDVPVVVPPPVPTTNPWANSDPAAIFDNGSRTLNRYSAGSDVGWVQTLVSATVDNYYGNETIAKVATWQGAHGLSPDGVFGPLSWGVALGAPQPTTGHNTDGSLTIDEDGVRGPQTISRWQEVMGTNIDGFISKPQSDVILADQRFLNAVVTPGDIANLDPDQSRRRDQLFLDGDEGPFTIKVRQYWLLNAMDHGVQIKLIGHLLDFDGILGHDTNTVHQHALNAATTASRAYGRV